LSLIVYTLFILIFMPKSPYKYQSFSGGSYGTKTY
jgi:hypothetical protein